MLVNPTRCPLVDLEASSVKTKQAQAFRLEEKKGRPEKTGQNEKNTSKCDLCPNFFEVWSQHYGASVSLCSVGHVLSQKL